MRKFKAYIPDTDQYALRILEEKMRKAELGKEMAVPECPVGFENINLDNSLHSLVGLL